MVNTELFKKLIKSKGHSQMAVCRTLGISYYGFLQKMNNNSCFSSKELYLLCKILELDNWEDIKKVFFNGVIKGKPLKTA